MHVFMQDGYGEAWRCSRCGLHADHPNHQHVGAVLLEGVRVIGPCAECGEEMEGTTPMWSVERAALVCRSCGESERAESVLAHVA